MSFDSASHQDSGRLDWLSLSLGIQTATGSWWIGSFPEEMEQYKLIEAGRFFNRRWIDGLRMQEGAPDIDWRLEIAAWPDRLTLALHPQEIRAATGVVDDVTLLLELDAASAAPVELPEPGRVAGRGSQLTSEQGTFTSREDGERLYTALRLSRRVSLVAEEDDFLDVTFTPTQNARDLAQSLSQPAPTVVVTATQTAPISASLTVTHNPVYGWHRVDLRNDNTRGDGSSNDRMEDVLLTATNPADTTQTLRLLFAKEDRVFGITGISAILCDEDGYPTGIPIQVSKNWHGWVWYHGFTLLTVPPNATVRFRYRSVNAHWGGVAAASHNQLCLVGWGGHQLWEEAALGAWGESICFDPNVGLNRAMVDDVRPLMVTPMDGKSEKWGWTNNVGGADFIVREDLEGNRQRPAMRVDYLRTGPNLTEVVYEGWLPDYTAKVECTVSLTRSDDIVRGIYRFRYDIAKEMPFNRLAFFQMGADRYNDHLFDRIAYGNEDGLIEEWTPATGGWKYHRTGMELTGDTPWFSLHEAHRPDAKGAWANRGLIIREWKARLGGEDVPTPTAAIYGTEDGGFASAVVDLTPPEGIDQLLPEDFVEAEVVQVVLPQKAGDYYGPNEALREALVEHGNTWRMVHREAVGNALVVEATGGEVLDHYPVKVATGGRDVTVSIEGGVGYVPVTFTELRDYRGYFLEQRTGDGWAAVNQSVHGLDFWQMDYDAESKTWDRTYNIPMDGVERVMLRFRAEGDD